MNKFEKIQEYFEDDAVSQSFLKEYINPRNLERNKEDDLYYQERKHFIKGGLIDLFTLTPDLFNNFYYADKLSQKPTDVVMSIIKEIYDNGEMLTNVDYVIDLAKNRGYTGNNWSDDTIYNRIFDGGTSGKNKIENLGEMYFDMLYMSNGKQVISQDEYLIAEETSLGLKATELYYNLFEKKHALNIYVQHPIYFDIDFKDTIIPCKALLDILVVNNTNEEYVLSKGLKMPPKSVLVIDLKSTGDYLDNFEKSIKRWRYDIQLAWYLKGVKDFYKNENYTYLNPIIWAVSIKEPQYPEIYELSDLDLAAAYLGKKSYMAGFNKDGQNIYNKYKEPILGINQLLDRYIYYSSHNRYYPKEYTGKWTTRLWDVQ